MMSTTRVGGVASQAGHSRRGHPARKQPEEVPMTPLYRVAAAAVAHFEVVVGKVRLKRDMSWHATVLQHSIATSYELAATLA